MIAQPGRRIGLRESLPETAVIGADNFRQRLSLGRLLGQPVVVEPLAVAVDPGRIKVRPQPVGRRHRERVRRLAHRWRMSTTKTSHRMDWASTRVRENVPRWNANGDENNAP